ncbi:hypothetical protein WJR50_23055 [Catalinimonas sp. 4WD22]|uniref:DUF2231 domain-containing protein n=1 Tax=Catalinimonas locisalis TaxID=3133978 RepID=UPI0031015013
MKTQATLIFSLFILFLCTYPLHAHEGENHQQTQQETTEHEESHHSKDETKQRGAEHSGSGKVGADFDDFPNLHPLLVHFPIVLLILAAILGIFNIFFLKQELNWVLTIVIFVATLGAYAAGRWYHPHTHDLTAQAKLVLEQHDLYADWTIYLSIAALIAQLIHHFIIKGKRWSMVAVALILIGGAYTVSHAAHYGSQLVYIEGVGPQGDFLETGAHSH